MNVGGVNVAHQCVPHDVDYRWFVVSTTAAPTLHLESAGEGQGRSTLATAKRPRNAGMGCEG
jgi:hypothetical protein